MLNLHAGRQRAQRGLSIVELLVGVAVGLFIVAGSTKLFVDYLSNNRGLLLETRINQDLRAAADLVARDLRRASYWRNAEAGLSSTLGVPAVDNPYKAVSYDGGTGVLTYSYDTIDVNTEAFGVKRAIDPTTGKGVLQLLTAGEWQTITDPGTLDIPANIPAGNGLTITPTAPRTVPLWEECPCIFELGCTKADFAGPVPGPQGALYTTRPRITIRQYVLNIRAQSSTNPTIVREIREIVRVRNDLLEGTCPA